MSAEPRKRKSTRYRDIAQYFWDEVTSERCYCTGGTSNGERWESDPGKLAHELGPDTTEDCCAYNMMKLTRHLFGWSPSAHYMDYYERALWNHRLGTIHPDDGTTMYYLPLGSGYWKIFGRPFDAFWCCTGTGVENHAKYGDSIYLHDEQNLYVNLFIASELNRRAKGLQLRQETKDSCPARRPSSGARLIHPKDRISAPVRRRRES